MCEGYNALENKLLSDQQIIALVIDGKIDAFGNLVARYQVPVFNLAYSLLTNRTDAEDATQDVFLRAYKSLHTYAGSGLFWSWLRRITVNICIRQAQSTKPIYCDDMDTFIDNDNEVCDSIICSEELEELRTMIYHLPLHYRSLVVLKYYEDMSYAEISEILGESISNIQVRLFRARKMLRESARIYTL
jgi:RNA polymerase sigma-70 factor (ECF subfamily)